MVFWFLEIPVGLYFFFLYVFLSLLNLEDFLFVCNFDGYTFVGFNIASRVDFGEGSMAEKLADFKASK